jgi:arylsulfatase A-like enzyme
MGQADNTIVVFTTDNGAEAITFPDGGVTPGLFNALYMKRSEHRASRPPRVMR